MRNKSSLTTSADSFSLRLCNHFSCRSRSTCEKTPIKVTKENEAGHAREQLQERLQEKDNNWKSENCGILIPQKVSGKTFPDNIFYHIF